MLGFEDLSNGILTQEALDKAREISKTLGNEILDPDDLKKTRMRIEKWLDSMQLQKKSKKIPDELL